MKQTILRCDTRGRKPVKASSRIIEELTGIPDLSAAAKTVYTVALVRQPESLKALAARIGMYKATAAKHCRSLECLGWMRLAANGGRTRPEAVVPRDVEAVLAAEFSSIIAVSPFKGEQTTMLFLEWVLAPAVRLIHHARPDFLRNPETGQNLEYDIFAPDHAWAIEYHGDQHFGPTALYQGEKQFIDRYRRDLLKARLSKQHNIRLSVITKDDLKLDSILQSIPAGVPLRAFDRAGPIIQMLEGLGEDIAGRQDADRE